MATFNRLHQGEVWTGEVSREPGSYCQEGKPKVH